MQNKYENKSNNLFLNDTFNSILALITHHMSLKNVNNQEKYKDAYTFSWRFYRVNVEQEFKQWGLYNDHL